MLKAPVTYQGAKQRIADAIVSIIKQRDTSYVDMCCGSGAVSIALRNAGVPADRITMVDCAEFGMFWEQIGTGDFDVSTFDAIISGLPKDRSRIQRVLNEYAGYDYSEVDFIPYWLVMQAGAFGGKQIYLQDGLVKNASMRSFWQPTETSNRRSPVNPMGPMPPELQRRVHKIVEEMRGCNGILGRVEDFAFERYENERKLSNVVVFVDPPYAGTTGYRAGFDYAAWLKQLDLPENYSVYVTDYVKHSDVFWEFNLSNRGGISGGGKKRVEIMSKIY